VAGKESATLVVVIYIHNTYSAYFFFISSRFLTSSQRASIFLHLYHSHVLNLHIQKYIFSAIVTRTVLCTNTPKTKPISAAEAIDFKI
jgi:hypothetical protein